MAKASSRTTRLPEGARRLRCTVGTSDKFYDIILEGDSYTVNYGRWGSSGAFQTKPFASAAEARRAYDAMIRSKLQKGYRDVNNNEGSLAESRRLAGLTESSVSEAISQASSRQSATNSGVKNTATKKTPESVGRKRRRLID